MISSRRGFLRLASIGAAVDLAVPWQSLAATVVQFEPKRVAPEPDVILLDSNENVYGPSPKVIEAMAASLHGANRYPRNVDSIVERIATLNNVRRQQVILGCGSTEILRMGAFAFLGSGKQLVKASPTFEAIQHYAAAAGSQVIEVPLTPTFAHDLDAMLARMDQTTTLVYICNPNNPTASLTPRKDLEDFIAKLPAHTYVIIDEAYHHYAGNSGMYACFIEHPVDNDRVIVARTFSKVYGMAGMRLGYAISSPKTIQRMRQFASEDNVNVLVAQVANVALDDTDSVNDFVRRNADDRQEFFNQAMARTMKPIDSHANFVMMDAFHPAQELIDHFRQNKILIGRHFPPMDTYIRVSLGRPEQMTAFWRVWDTLPYPKGSMHH